MELISACIIQVPNNAIAGNTWTAPGDPPTIVCKFLCLALHSIVPLRLNLCLLLPLLSLLLTVCIFTSPQSLSTCAQVRRRSLHSPQSFVSNDSFASSQVFFFFFPFQYHNHGALADSTSKSLLVTSILQSTQHKRWRILQSKQYER